MITFHNPRLATCPLNNNQRCVDSCMLYVRLKSTVGEDNIGYCALIQPLIDKTRTLEIATPKVSSISIQIPTRKCGE